MAADGPARGAPPAEVLAEGQPRRAQTDLPFPRWAHLPGVTAGADHAPLEVAKALVPPRFETPPAPDHPALAYGVALCDAGFYWEAHEVLEAVWMATCQNTSDRIVLRALIQLANAGLKLRMARPRAALRLLAEVAGLVAEIRTRGTGPGVAGAIQAHGLAHVVRHLAEAVAAGESAALPLVSRYLDHARKCRHHPLER